MIPIDPDATQHEILARIGRMLPVRKYLEIGVRDGCTLWVVVEASPLQLAACADTWGRVHGGTGRESHAHIEDLFRAIGYGGRRMWLDGSSQITLPDLILSNPELKFDMIHVDGDHDESPAYQDCSNSWRLLRRGGAVVVHDMSHPPVAKAVKAFCADVNARPITCSGGHGTAVVWKGDTA